jgi:hypothetical protein
MKLFITALILGAITEGAVWLDLLVHPVGQGPMAMPSPFFLWLHLPGIMIEEAWPVFDRNWLRIAIWILPSWLVWSLLWAALLGFFRKVSQSRTQRSSRQS